MKLLRLKQNMTKKKKRCLAGTSIIYILFLNCLSVYLLQLSALLWGNGNKCWGQISNHRPAHRPIR